VTGQATGGLRSPAAPDTTLDSPRGRVARGGDIPGDHPWSGAGRAGIRARRPRATYRFPVDDDPVGHSGKGDR
jgi:hypothetical protein